MKFLKWFFLSLLALIVIYLVIAAFAPKEMKVEKSIYINASPEVVYDYVRNFRNFNSWSPWAAKDYNMKLTNSEVDGQVGSWQAWKGNEEVGSGKMTITGMTPTRIDVKVEFIEPWPGVNPSFYKITPEGKGTRFSWGFESENPFPMNGFALLFGMEEMLGKDFQKGVENLKKQVEKRSTPANAA